MPDVTIKRIEEMDSLGGRFVRCRAELGVTSFGLQVYDLPPNDESIPRRRDKTLSSAWWFEEHGQSATPRIMRGGVG